jgi:nucleoside-diphosphate-sugar epimerase
MARYLVTGVAGFIGSRTAEILLEAGHELVGIDDLNDAYDVRVKEYRLERLRGRPGFRFERLDIADRSAVSVAAFQREDFDAVVNLAARAGVRASVENPWVYVDANVTGALNLLEFCRSRGVPKFVLASSSSVYGAEGPIPYREDQDTSRPISPYAASKKSAEALCFAFHSLHGLDVTVLRYFTAYGPAGRPDMSVFRFTQAIREGRPIYVYGDGTMSRDFTYVDDIARGTVAALEPLGYEIINLGGDHPYQVIELVRLIEQRLGRSARIEFEDAHPADVLATWADIHRAEKLMGWRPQVSLEEGISRTVEWYEAERHWAGKIPAY